MGIRHALAGGGFVVCAEVGDAEGAVAAAVGENPDICLLDVHMPGSGLLAAERIAARVPGAAVVMISASSDDAIVFAALRAGAVGFLVKDAVFGRLPEALLGVLNGEAAVPRGLTARLIDEFPRGTMRRSLQPGPSWASFTLQQNSV